MGYIEETGAAQHFRDARIAAIYEGTNGIQAIDLVARKVPLNGGKTVEAYIGELREIVSRVKAVNDPSLGETGARLEESVECLERATHWLLKQQDAANIQAAATPYLRLFGNTAGGCMLADDALAALRTGDGASRIALTRFFAENIVVQASGLERAVNNESINSADAALA